MVEDEPLRLCPPPNHLPLHTRSICEVFLIFDDNGDDRNLASGVYCPSLSYIITADIICLTSFRERTEIENIVVSSTQEKMSSIIYVEKWLDLQVEIFR